MLLRDDTHYRLCDILLICGASPVVCNEIVGASSAGTQSRSCNRGTCRPLNDSTQVHALTGCWDTR